jgi:hypothetical protein
VLADLHICSSQSEEFSLFMVILVVNMTTVDRRSKEKDLFFTKLYESSCLLYVLGDILSKAEHGGSSQSQKDGILLKPADPVPLIPRKQVTQEALCDHSVDILECK